MTEPLPPNSDNYHQGVIGNGRSAAVIEPDATISFACLPDFDSGTAFAQLLDPKLGGSFGISMDGGSPVSQIYEPRTNILVTRFEGPAGAFDVIDFMPRYTWDGKAGTDGDAAPDIVRVLKPAGGTPVARVHYDPRPDYARFPAHTGVTHGIIKTTTTGTHPDGQEIYESLFLYSDIPNTLILGSDPVPLDSQKYLLVTYHDKVQPPTAESVELMLQRTRAYWLLWSARTHTTDRFAPEVLRSALTLKLLQFNPTGAICAAATTSLPETIGEVRNWDYRFCWIRDGSMTVAVLHRIGHPRMAQRFVDWVLHTVPTKDDALQIMYGLRGEKTLTEETLDHLSGYHGSDPVRIGNDAYHQEQHDIYGVLLDVVHQDLSERTRTPEALDRIYTRVRAVVRTVASRWKEPDRGIWEIRGDNRHFVFSKVLCWVAVDRAIKIARMLDKHDWADSQTTLLNSIHDDICTKGWNSEVGAFTQSYGSPELDSSNLLMAEYGFIDPKDPRFISTVEQSEKQLCRDGLMYRYKNHDDFGEPSSAFTVCSFWMVKALARTGRRKDAAAMFEKLLAAANPKGLYGEDLDFSTRRHLGNFPQAYSHLALIDCAMELSNDVPEDAEELIQP